MAPGETTCVQGREKVPAPAPRDYNTSRKRRLTCVRGKRSTKYPIVLRAKTAQLPLENNHQLTEQYVTTTRIATGAECTHPPTMHAFQPPPPPRLESTALPRQIFFLSAIFVATGNIVSRFLQRDGSGRCGEEAARGHLG